PGLIANPAEAESAGRQLAGDRDRPRGDLAAASALRRTGRPPSQRAGRYVLSGRRRQGDVERAADRELGRVRAPRRARGRQSRRGAADFGDTAMTTRLAWI